MTRTSIVTTGVPVRCRVPSELTSPIHIWSTSASPLDDSMLFSIPTVDSPFRCTYLLRLGHSCPLRQVWSFFSWSSSPAFSLRPEIYLFFSGPFIPFFSLPLFTSHNLSHTPVHHLILQAYHIHPIILSTSRSAPPCQSFVREPAMLQFQRRRAKTRRLSVRGETVRVGTVRGEGAVSPRLGTLSPVASEPCRAAQSIWGLQRP
jgi:hypothetical protein